MILFSFINKKLRLRFGFRVWLWRQSNVMLY